MRSALKSRLTSEVFSLAAGANGNSKITDLNPRLVQCSVSFNTQKGTLRGIHYQAEPYPEAKLVRCTRGSMYDVVVDLRQDSPTYKDWVGVVLTAEKRNMVYAPEGCGHGFLTWLTD